ncbi:cytoplasmic RNA-binding protein [Apophysomyces ossiformis]|uniref:Cytoplasmic RNA-binding protein n=1 Tax=Apophysomyces ossiformis TaxID=679940 RepID=A0A8H7ET17_9FUNG|nr:cytoplasmic RNA-binding protein [Apophysomyces ossiformis]
MSDEARELAEQIIVEAEAPTMDTQNHGGEQVDKELEAMRAHVKHMEEEAARLRYMQSEVERSMRPEEDKEVIDSRSIYIGNVDYGTTPEELQAHFQACGTINRVTILCDKFSGHPKGYAYIEFAEPAFVAAAITLNESLFRGRMLKVGPKRTNIPGFSQPRGRGRGGFRGAFRGMPYYGHSPMYGYRGRGRNLYKNADGP